MEDYTQQDVIVINIIRACEQAIDIAGILAKSHGLRGLSTSAKRFTLLQETGLVNAEMANDLERMVGFRNLAVHLYHEIDYNIVESVIKNKLGQLSAFADLAIDHLADRESPKS